MSKQNNVEYLMILTKIRHLLSVSLNLRQPHMG